MTVASIVFDREDECVEKKIVAGAGLVSTESRDDCASVMGADNWAQSKCRHLYMVCRSGEP